ncbi:DUF1853 family protein [Halomonas sp. 18H]|nr:DUF1853 family protein [Halomonas sp. 18H]MCW4152898.1 DUF1853 family protein [Halomonas sp. 18H]
MPPYDTDFLERWQHPQVRNLAWLLSAPDLLSLAWPGRPTRQSLGLGSRQALQGYLDRQAEAPAMLEAMTGEPGASRLGHYHERLWQYLLQTAPGTRLRVHNLAVIRGRRTRGELDLVYQQRQGDTTPIHLELAIKFYLGLPSGPGRPNDPARWIGTNGVDSLALKQAHLERHQFPLAHSPDARDALATALGPSWQGRLQQRLAMPGVLFYPWEHPMPAPVQAHSAHYRGLWLHWAHWPAFAATLDDTTRGSWLGKPHWLAPPARRHLLGLDELAACLAEHFAHSGAPRQLALYRPGKGWQRVFVVEDDWPRQIPLGPSG